MNNLEIQCPECQHVFAPDQAFHHHVAHLLKAERSKMNNELLQQQRKLEAEADFSFFKSLYKEK